jgi:hypothetical protein
LATIHCCECGLFKSTEEGIVDLRVHCSTHITSTMDGFLLISEQLFGSPVVDKEKKYTCMRIYILKVVIHNNLMVQALRMLSLLEHVAQETVIESLLCIAASSRHARGLLLIPTLSEKKNQSFYGW